MENKKDVHLIMQWSQSGTRAKAQNLYSDSDDEMCEVRDESEEITQHGAVLSLFLKSPTTKQDLNESEDFKENTNKKRHSRNIKLPNNRSAATLSLQINSSSIGRVSRTKESLYRTTIQSTGPVYEDDTCVVSSDSNAGDKPVRAHIN